MRKSDLEDILLAKTKLALANIAVQGAVGNLVGRTLTKGVPNLNKAVSIGGKGAALALAMHLADSALSPKPKKLRGGKLALALGAGALAGSMLKNKSGSDLVAKLRAAGKDKELEAYGF